MHLYMYCNDTFVSSVEQKAPRSVMNADGLTALHYAAECPTPRGLRTLLASRAAADVEGGVDGTPLDHAVRSRVLPRLGYPGNVARFRVGLV